MDRSIVKVSAVKSSYTLVDLLKLFLALLIVLSHYLNEHAAGKLPKILDLSVSIYIIAVPIYFAFSGFFLFKKIYRSEPEQQFPIVSDYCLKIMRLYGFWSIIYVGFQILTWIRFTPEQSEVLGYLHRSLVYSTYNTIWYLPASAVGVMITYWIRKKFGDQCMFTCAVIFCLIGALGDCYSGLIQNVPGISQIFEAYRIVFITTRNGVFNGFPYIAVGAFIAYRSQNDTKEYHHIFNRYFFASLISGVLFIGEALFAKLVAGANNSNMIVTLLIFTYSAVCWSVVSVQPNINKDISLFLRKMSTAIFLSQRLFLSALPGLFPGSIFTVMLDDKSWVIGLCWTLFCTILFSAVLILISGKVKFLRYFYQ